MIRVDVNTALEVLLAAKVTTRELPCYSSFADFNATANNTYQPGSQWVNTNSQPNPSAVQLVPPTQAGSIRSCDYLSVFNADTVAATVTIRANGPAGIFTLYSASLAIGDLLTYTHARGWAVRDSSGYEK